MESRFLEPDPLEERIERVLSLLEQGELPDRVEESRVDVKEEPGRRTPQGDIVPGGAENEEAARYLAGEMACMANTQGGGAVILGVADDGAMIGTGLETERLRRRIWELTEGKLTVSVRAASLGRHRLLVLSTHQAVEPIRYEGRYRWRVNDHCVEVDATLISARMSSWKYDWSVQPSGHTLSDVSPIAVEFARRFLRRSGRRDDTDLADAADSDLVRRLDLVDGQGRLTNAGSLLFAATPDVGIDYICREVPGGDSINRIRSAGPLLHQIAEVEQAASYANRVHHLLLGFTMRRVRSIPARVVREAIVNGVVHRDWHSPHPTTVEHIGDQMTVTSPGGFVGTVTPSNIITHPAVPRYPGLAKAVAALRLAQSEGVGVDLMVRNKLALGLPLPDFYEMEGPYVRVSLLGGAPDPVMVEFLDGIELEPEVLHPDVDLLLIIDHLIREGWADARSAAPVLQRSEPESAASLRRVSVMTSGGHPVIVHVRGIPAGHPPAYRLSDRSREVFAYRSAPTRTPEGRKAMILRWARGRGRVSSTEAADLTGLTVTYSGKLLGGLADYGVLVGSRPRKAGRGFHYLPSDPDT